MVCTAYSMYMWPVHRCSFRLARCIRGVVQDLGRNTRQNRVGGSRRVAAYVETSCDRWAWASHSGGCEEEAGLGLAGPARHSTPYGPGSGQARIVGRVARPSWLRERVSVASRQTGIGAQVPEGFACWSVGCRFGLGCDKMNGPGVAGGMTGTSGGGRGRVQRVNVNNRGLRIATTGTRVRITAGRPSLGRCLH